MDRSCNPNGNVPLGDGSAKRNKRNHQPPLHGREGMDRIVEMVPNWNDEMLGFNQGTLVVLLGLLALVFKLRLVAMMTIPKLFQSLCEKSPVAKEALQGSSKSLGTAIGAAI